eukprot:gb/GECH01008622.1/.p1 GENE.gb/GECH01008622.1/~~gb/GECH01008622.1/.p1  ORF type:complete len:935 (+),score=252.70 gb/GECH01008622.1/:1-2805(+)
MASEQTFRVFQAENGKAYEFNIRSRESVDKLKELLSQPSRIPPEQQILLASNGTMLENSKTLSNYEFQNDKIFLFSRQTFTSERPPEYRQPAVLEVPSRETIEVPENFYVEDNPVSFYAQKIFKQFKIAETIEKLAEDRYFNCEKSKEEHQVQLKAIEAAANNLQMHEGNIRSKLNSYKNKFEKANSKHEEILNDFDSDVKSLKKIKLHSSLLSESKSTLYDCIPEKQLREWALKLERDNNDLKTKTQDLEKQCNGLVEEIRTSGSNRPIGQFQYLDQQLGKSSNLREKQHELYYNINQDVEIVKRLLSSPPTDFSKLDERLEKNEENLREMHENDDQMRKTLHEVYTSKYQLSQQLYKYLREISKFQSHIRKIGRRIAVYSEVIKRHNQRFRHLELVHRLPETYIRCLQEVVRRRGYRRRFIAATRTSANQLNKLREHEVLEREQFTRTYAALIPQNLVPGLNEKPPSYKPSTPSFDSNLPQIDSLQELEEDTLNYIKGQFPSLEDLNDEPEKENENALFDTSYHETTDSYMEKSKEIEFLNQKLSNKKQELIEAHNKIESMQEQISKQKSNETSVSSTSNKEYGEPSGSHSSTMSGSDSSDNISSDMGRSQNLLEKYTRTLKELEKHKREAKKYKEYYTFSRNENDSQRDEIGKLKAERDDLKTKEQRLQETVLQLEQNQNQNQNASSSNSQTHSQNMESLSSTDSSSSETNHRSQEEENRPEQENQDEDNQIQSLRSKILELKDLVSMKEDLRSEAIQNCAHSERKLKNLSQILETTNLNFEIILDILIEYSKDRLPYVYDLLKQVKNSTNTSTQTKISSQDLEPLRETINQLTEISENETKIVVRNIQVNQIALAGYFSESQVWQILTADEEDTYQIAESSASILNSRSDAPFAFVKILNIDSNVENANDNSKRESSSFIHVVEVEPHSL